MRNARPSVKPAAVVESIRDSYVTLPLWEQLKGYSVDIMLIIVGRGPPLRQLAFRSIRYSTAGSAWIRQSGFGMAFGG